MSFVTSDPGIVPEKPLFCSILANTMLSTVPGISGAGPTPEKTLLTPILDAELIANGSITSLPIKPNTPTGCPTPATITRAMMELTGLFPLFINAGLVSQPTIPCLDVYGAPGDDPRFGDAVPRATDLFAKGESLGNFLSSITDFLVLGECVPGGTTTSLCVLRGLGYPARVSSSYIQNPISMKEEVWEIVATRMRGSDISSPIDAVRIGGDPMIALGAGIASGFSNKLVLAGGTQMLSVAAIIKGMGKPIPSIATTCYVRDDPSANFEEIAEKISTPVFYIDPDFGALGHSGLARYCIGEVKEGMGAGGAMFLAYLMGFPPELIRKRILEFVHAYT